MLGPLCYQKAKTMTLLWVTDTHLDYVRVSEPSKTLAQYLVAENPNADALLISGDISNGGLIEKHLRELANNYPHPIFLVTGNHDYYFSSFKDVDAKVHKVVAKFPNLHWLDEHWVTYHGIPIVGVGGWYDAYYGNVYTKEQLNDFYEIKELRPGLHYHDLLLKLVRDRAGAQADNLASMLKEACLIDSDTVIVTTHVAPYLEASWYRGKQSERDMAPWFTSASTGAVLDTYADKYPEKTFVVLCGHSHSPGIFQRKDNMIVYTGRAQYGFPDLSGVIDADRKMLWAYDPACQKVERPFKP